MVQRISATFPKINLCWVLVSVPLALCAQQDTLHVTPEGTSHAPAATNVGAAKVYTIVDQMPQFPGGEAAMFAYLMSQVNYPADAFMAGVSGVVHTSFVVQEDGSLRDITLLRGVHPLLDEEALRVVRSMPKWEPGKHKSQVCCVQFNLPIRFSIGRSQYEPKEEQLSLAADTTGADSSVQATAEVMPQFPGGELELFKFLGRNIRYPSAAESSNAQGVVYLTYTIDRDGTIRDPVVLASPHPSLSLEALRIVGLMPKWSPGMQKGKPVTVQYQLPIRFTMR